MIRMIATIVAILWCSFSTAQEESIVRISGTKTYRTPEGFTASQSWFGTGSIVEVIDDNIKGDMRRVKILTAAHVVSGAHRIVVKTLGGHESTMAIRHIGNEIDNDIAWGETVVPDAYEPIPISKSPASDSSEITIFGLAGLADKFPDVKPRQLKTKRIGTLFSDTREYYDYPVSPGDSGGPILADGKIVGVVSGGMRQVKSDLGFNTWPLVSATTKNINELLAK